MTHYRYEVAEKHPKAPLLLFLKDVTRTDLTSAGGAIEAKVKIAFMTDFFLR